MMTLSPHRLAGVIAIALLASGCGHTIRPGQAGLKYKALSHPALQEQTLEDGFYVQWWWNKLVVYDTTWQSRDVDVEVLTADDLHVPTRSTVTYGADPERIYELHTTIGPNYYDEIITPALVTIIRDEFSEHAHNDLARDSNVIDERVTARLLEAVAGMPIRVHQVTTKHIEFDSDVTGAISRKLMMQQQAEQKDFEIEVASRDAEIARTIAQGQSDATRIQAEGDASAIVLRGTAQAQAQAEISETLTRPFLQYKAFDSDTTTYYFAPIGRDGLPVIVQP